jgi:hypothetical protein
MKNIFSFKLICLTFVIFIELKEIQTRHVVSVILNRLRSNRHYHYDQTNKSKLVEINQHKRIKRDELSNILDLPIESIENMIRTTKSNSYFITALDKILNGSSSSSSSYLNSTNGSVSNETVVEYSEPQAYEYFVCDSESLAFMYSCIEIFMIKYYKMDFLISF